MGKRDSEWVGYGGRDMGPKGGVLRVHRQRGRHGGEVTISEFCLGWEESAWELAVGD